MKKRMKTLLAGALLSLALMSCAGQIPYHLTNTPGVVTLTNLHPDMERMRLYSTDYLQNGLIPMCTSVTITSVNAKRMLFTLSTGQRFEYVFDRRTMQEDIATHLDRYFGTDCKKGQIDTMSEIDQQGIREGHVLPGMTRTAVVFAIGYPPSSLNQMQAPTWTYMKNRFDRLEVIFAGDVVQEVRD